MEQVKCFCASISYVHSIMGHRFRVSYVLEQAGRCNVLEEFRPRMALRASTSVIISPPNQRARRPHVSGTTFSSWVISP